MTDVDSFGGPPQQRVHTCDHFFCFSGYNSLSRIVIGVLGLQEGVIPPQRIIFEDGNVLAVDPIDTSRGNKPGFRVLLLDKFSEKVHVATLIIEKPFDRENWMKP